MRRLFLIRSVGLALAGVFGATAPMAQQPKKLPRVAYVWIFWLGPSAPFESAFREELRKVGWIEGRNIAVDVRDAEGDPKKLAAIMSRINLFGGPGARIAGPLTTKGQGYHAHTKSPVAGWVVCIRFTGRHGGG